MSSVRNSHPTVAEHASHGVDEPFPHCFRIPCAWLQVAGHRRLGQPVEHADPGADERERALEDRRRNARAADMDRLQAIEPLVAGTQVIEAAHELGRHQRGAPRAGLLHESGERLRIEPAQHDRRPREQVRHQDHLRDRPQRPHGEETLSLAMPKPSMVLRATVIRLRCRSIAAFGAPVVPPLKLRLARLVAIAIRRRPLGCPAPQVLVGEAGTAAAMVIMCRRPSTSSTSRSVAAANDACATNTAAPA